MTNEYKTLRELDVQPGDVVCDKIGVRKIIIDITEDAAYSTGGYPLLLDNPIWRIVSRASDTTKRGRPRASVSPDHAWEVDDTPKLWRDMTPEEKGALLLAKHEGKVIECYFLSGWVECNPEWYENFAYRVRPEPNRETVTYTWEEDVLAVSSLNMEGTHRITFDLIDGKPDCDSIKMEEL
jgi:hypothetical protein